MCVSVCTIHMEVDHVPYIFGSFSRRRQSQVAQLKQRVDQLVVSSSSSSLVTKSAAGVASMGDVSTGVGASATGAASRLSCSMCGGLLLEPRVLACLHTFCTKCLLELEKKEVWDAEPDEPETRRGSRASSGGATLAEGECSVTCPVCGARTPLHRQGVLGLPPNYVLQHRIVLATLNSDTTQLLCDVCTADVPATHRCVECLVNVCERCAEKHRKQRTRHEVVGLREARQRGTGLRVHRQIMCVLHGDQPLLAYCATCSQVVCKDCMRAAHAGHECEPATRAARARGPRLGHALQRARAAVERAAALERRLHACHGAVEAQCRQLEEEVDKFMEAYIRALDEHRTDLLRKVDAIRQERLEVVRARQQEVARRLADATHVVHFADELVREGSDVELLTFVAPVQRRLEHCAKLSADEQLLAQVSGGVHFLPHETVQPVGVPVPLHGAISTQTVAPDQCVLHKEDVESLRVHRRAEIMLETRDCLGQRVPYGGEAVSAELWYRDAGTSCRSLEVSVTDNRNGTYTLSFTPDTPGKLSMLVSVKGQQVRDSPLPIVVRNLRPHRGTYHCCNFCSSGGNKDATCACGGTMPGGYKGCGHGHDGHPGRRHWSCCGNVLENSECGRINSVLYQFTL